MPFDVMDVLGFRVRLKLSLGLELVTSGRGIQNLFQHHSQWNLFCQRYELGQSKGCWWVFKLTDLEVGVGLGLAIPDECWVLG